MFTAELSKEHSRGLMILCATTFMALTTELAPVALILDIAKTFHMEVGHVGLAMGAYAIIVAVCAVPLTRLSSIFDRKRMMVFAALAYMVCNLIGAVAPNFWILCAGRMIGGVAHCITMSMAPAYGARMVSAKYKGRAITLVFSGASIGSVVGMPATAALGGWIGWRLTLVITALIGLIGMFLLLRYLPRISAADEENQRKAQAPIKGAVRTFFWAISVTTVMFTARNLLYTFMAPILVEHGLAEAWIGLVLLIISFASLLGVWYSGKVVDKSPRRGAFAGAIAMIIGMLPVCFAHSSILLVTIGAIVWGAGFSSMVPIAMSGAMSTRIASSDVTSAAINSCCNVGIFLGATVGGQLIAYLSIAHLAVVSIVLVLVGMAIIRNDKQAFPNIPAHMREN